MTDTNSFMAPQKKENRSKRFRVQPTGRKCPSPIRLSLLWKRRRCTSTSECRSSVSLRVMITVPMSYGTAVRDSSSVNRLKSTCSDSFRSDTGFSFKKGVPGFIMNPGHLLGN